MSGNAKVDPKKVEKSASQNSTAGSVSAHASAVKDKRKHAKSERKVDTSQPQLNTAISSSSVIKTPGKKEISDVGVGRRTTSGAVDNKDKDKHEKTEKGILKNKKSRAKSGMDVKKTVVKSKGKPKPHKRTFFESIALSMGFHVGEVTLTDPYAVEAAQALDLQQWHLRRLKLRYVLQIMKYLSVLDRGLIPPLPTCVIHVGLTR
jgi:hypothetical protein